MNCKYMSAILAIVVLVFSFWSVTWINWLTSEWIIVAAAALIFLHEIMPRNCCRATMPVKAPMKKKAVKRKKKK